MAISLRLNTRRRTAVATALAWPFGLGRFPLGFGLHEIATLRSQ